MGFDVLGLSGRTDSEGPKLEGPNISIVWAALITRAAFKRFDVVKRFEWAATEGLGSIDWSTSDGLLEDDGQVNTMSSAVLIDRKLQRAIARIPKDGAVAIAAAAYVLGAELPCGGVMWTAPGEGNGDKAQAGPMSFTGSGLCMWAEQGRWCAVAECAPSVMAAVAEIMSETAADRLLEALAQEASVLGIETMLVVVDASGRPEGAGGVLYLANGETRVLKVQVAGHLSLG